MKYPLKKWPAKALITDLISALLILLFMYAGIIKLSEYQKFSVQIGQSPILTPFAAWLAWLLPCIEVIIAIMLAVPRLRLPGFYASFTLMVMFTAYIVTILNASYHVPCHCGGVLEKLSWKQHIVFNAVFILLSLAGVLIETSSRIQNHSKNSTRLAYN